LPTGNCSLPFSLPPSLPLSLSPAFPRLRTPVSVSRFESCGVNFTQCGSADRYLRGHGPSPIIVHVSLRGSSAPRRGAGDVHASACRFFEHRALPRFGKDRRQAEGARSPPVTGLSRDRGRLCRGRLRRSTIDHVKAFERRRGKEPAERDPTLNRSIVRIEIPRVGRGGRGAGRGGDTLSSKRRAQCGNL